MEDVEVSYLDNVLDQYENENQVRIYAEVSSPKFKQKFQVYNPKDGTHFFQVRFADSSDVANTLKGKFTKIDLAVSAIKVYIASAKPSLAVERDRKANARAERKA